MLLLYRIGIHAFLKSSVKYWKLLKLASFSNSPSQNYRFAFYGSLKYKYIYTHHLPFRLLCSKFTALFLALLTSLLWITIYAATRFDWLLIVMLQRTDLYACWLTTIIKWNKATHARFWTPQKSIYCQMLLWYLCMDFMSKSNFNVYTRGIRSSHNNRRKICGLQSCMDISSSL